MEKTLNPKKSNNQNDKIANILSLIQKDSELSQDLLKMDVHTSLAGFINLALTNPVASICHTYNKVSEDIIKLFTQLISIYLHKQAKVLSGAYQKPNSLDFYLVFREEQDTFENRRAFFRDLDQFREIDESGKLDINFIFIPHGIDHGIDKKFQISLDGDYAGKP